MSEKEREICEFEMDLMNLFVYTLLVSTITLSVSLALGTSSSSDL